MVPLTWDEFERVEMRVGTVLEAELLPNARIPAIVMRIDFGPELGEKRSSARITALYSPESMVGRQVVAVVNFPPRQIGSVMSECLVLGAVDAGGSVTLLVPERSVPNGLKIA